MNQHRCVLAALAVFALGAHAQGTGAAGTVTESTDPAKAAAVERAASEVKARQAQAARSGQPQSSAVLVRGQTDGGLAFLSGGITSADRSTMSAERDRFSLWVATVAKGSGAYLSDARLHIVDLKGKAVVVDRVMDGPWFMLALPAGRYEVAATLKGDGADAEQTLKTQVSIPARGQRQAVLRFVSSATVSPDMDSQFKGNPFGAPPATK